MCIPVLPSYFNNKNYALNTRSYSVSSCTRDPNFLFLKKKGDVQKPRILWTTVKDVLMELNYFNVKIRKI